METIIQHIRIEKEIPNGETLDLTSYENLIPISRYAEFCDTDSFTLSFESEGSFESEILFFKNNSDIKIIKSQMFKSEDYALAGIRIKALSNCFIKACNIVCDAEPKTVNLALCVCSYKTEELVRKKVEELSELAEIYVCDNSSSVDELPNAHLIKSPNLGGSSGFARTIAEAYQNKNITHFILNDDDALLDKETLFRTKTFLSLCKKEICICGTMLDLDEPDKVIDAGAQISGCEIIPHHRFESISSLETNIKITQTQDIKYGGWWYFVLPRDLPKQIGMPLPFFFQIDDVEYGYRIPLEIVNIVGISVKHKNFTSKYNPVVYYYYLRNMMAFGFLSGRFTEEDVIKLIEKIHLETACLRYRHSELMLEALEDFLKGPEHLFNLCRNGIKPTPVYPQQDLAQFRETSTPKSDSYRLRKYTLNGALLPSKARAVRKITDMETSSFYRLKEVYFSIDGSKDFIVRKQPMKSIHLILKTMSLQRKIIKSFDRLQKEYKSAAEKYSTIESWNEFWGTDYKL